MLGRQQPPIRMYVCSHTLPVSRRGFASVVQQGNSLLETAPGWPGEGLSSSLKTSHRAAGTCQDGCYLAKQRDPCLPASTVENRGERGCCSQSGPLLMSLRVPAWRVKPQLWAVPRNHSRNDIATQGTVEHPDLPFTPHTHTDTHIDTHTDTYTHTHTQTHTHTHSHTHTHTLSLSPRMLEWNNCAHTYSIVKDE